MVGYKVPGSHATLNCTEGLSKVVIVIHRILSSIKFNNTRYSEDTCIKIRTFMSFIFMVFAREKKEKQDSRTENIQLYQLTLLHIQYCTRESVPSMRVFCFAPVLPLVKCCEVLRWCLPRTQESHLCTMWSRGLEYLLPCRSSSLFLDEKKTS